MSEKRIIVWKVVQSWLYKDLARAESEALFNIDSFLKENIKSSNTRDRVKTTRAVKNSNSRSN